jgi:hypothetical protein
LASKDTKALCWTCVGILAAATGAIIWLAGRPIVNQAQAAAMLPVINSYLAKDPQLAQSSLLDARLKPRMFCDSAIIEIRPDGPRWHVGLQISCDELARSQKKLRQGFQGDPGIADIATLAQAGGRYKVANLQIGPPWWDKAWVDQNFSSRAASWILSTAPPTAPDPTSQALRALGFPPGTRAAGDRYGRWQAGTR